MAGAEARGKEKKMPKAVRFSELGGPEVLRFEDVAERQPGAGEVRLKVEAVGLNRAESMYFHGQYIEQPQMPSGLGYELVGRVTAVGEGVDAGLVGKRFGTVPGYSMNRYPALVEESVVEVTALAQVPEGFAAAEAAAVWMQYGTAYGALVQFGKVAKGDFVIVTAASSSVGLAAIEIVKAEGGVAIATTRTAEKKARLLELGADHVIVTEDEDLPARVKEITGGKGARIVFDPVGGSYMNTLGQAAGKDATIFLYGMLSGQPTPYPMAAFGKGVSLRAYSLVEIRSVPEWLEAMKRYVLERLEDGRFKPVVAKTFSFAETVEAYRYLESNQQIGKVVVLF